MNEINIINTLMIMDGGREGGVQLCTTIRVFCEFVFLSFSAHTWHPFLCASARLNQNYLSRGQVGITSTYNEGAKKKSSSSSNLYFGKYYAHVINKVLRINALSQTISFTCAPWRCLPLSKVLTISFFKTPPRKSRNTPKSSHVLSSSERNKRTDLWLAPKVPQPRRPPVRRTYEQYKYMLSM